MGIWTLQWQREALEKCCLFICKDFLSLLQSVFVKILQKNWLGVFLSLKNLSRGFAPTLRYPRIFF